MCGKGEKWGRRKIKMGDLVVALVTIFGTVASVTGVVLYVFNGTKNLIREMHETQKEIVVTQNKIIELIEKLPRSIALAMK